MKNLSLRGSVGGFPVDLALTSLGAELMLEAASGLIMVLAAGTTVWLAAKMLGGLLDILTARKKHFSIGRVSQITWFPNRRFVGVCMTPTISFDCGGQTLQAPLTSVHKIESDGYKDVTRGPYKIKMIDGSEYSNVQVLMQSLSFLTTAGQQFVNFVHPGQREVMEPVYKEGFWGRKKVGEQPRQQGCLWVPTASGQWRSVDFQEESRDRRNCSPACHLDGLGVDRAEDLRVRLADVLSSNRQPITEAIGKEAFETFFRL